MKNLIIAFCSIKPKQYAAIHSFREQEYFNSLSQLYRIAPKSFDVIIVDNTLNSLNDLNNHDFINFLQNKSFQASDNNLGSVNKGAGEIWLLKRALENLKINNISYDRIIYLTARHFYTSPYFFEKAENMDVEALISNPDFVFIKSGLVVKSEKNGMYNDMVFAMNNSTMQKYADYSDLGRMIKENIGSEQNLYNFIHENKISYELIEHIGLIRNDFQRTGDYLNFDNFHVC